MHTGIFLVSKRDYQPSPRWQGPGWEWGQLGFKEQAGGGVGWWWEVGVAWGGEELRGRRALRIIKAETEHAGPATSADSPIDLTHFNLPCGLLWPNPA